MSKRILLLTKDAMCKSYLPVYGNKYWKGKTPNIDELAEKGTVFHNYYTAAPSTVMAFRSMMFGTFAHEQPYSDYIPMEIPEPEDSFFSIAQIKGLKSHLMWDKKWVRMVLRYGNMIGKNVKIHNINGLNQSVGVHYSENQNLSDNDELVEQTIKLIEQEVKQICQEDEDIFLWIHLPHVIMGRCGYGEDMDAFDMMVGMLRNYFSDDNIYISTDHGNMDGYHGKFSYGFDVYSPAIEIPLITPRICGMADCFDYISNVDIRKIIFERIIPKREFIFADCAYYAQPQRKLAIIHKGFSYIYSKKGKKEELYDLENDRFERCNLIRDTFYDEDRGLSSRIKEVYFSPRWDEIDEIRSIMRSKKNEIWRQPSLIVDLRGRFFSFAKKTIVKVMKLVRKLVGNNISKIN